MSIDYNFSLCVGYRLSGDVVRSKFQYTIADVTHEEPRWDPLTGIPTDPEVIVDKAGGIYYRLPGSDDDIEFEEELYDALAYMIHCRASYTSDHSDEVTWVVFEPTNLPVDTDSGYDAGRVSCDGSIQLSHIVALDAEIRRIGDALRNLGLPVEEPVVQIIWSIG